MTWLGIAASLVQFRVCLGKHLRSGDSPCVRRVFYLSDSGQRVVVGRVRLVHGWYGESVQTPSCFI
jgi:hypothetical protein